MSDRAKGEELGAALMAEMAAQAGPGMKLPPPIFTEIGARITAYEPGKSITVHMDVQERYQNPASVMQGGMVVTLMDCALGPLAYLVAPPSSTSQLNTTYLRPIGPDLPYVTCTATYLGKAGRSMQLMAEVHDPDGRVLARSLATHIIMGR